MHASAEQLQAAIAAVTVALATTLEPDVVLELVRERAHLRRELPEVETTRSTATLRQGRVP